MSTRIHWAEDGHRSCTHGRTATHREVSAAGRAAESVPDVRTGGAEGNDKAYCGSSGPICRRACSRWTRTSFVAHFGIGKLVTGSAVCAKRNGACFRIQATETPGLLTGIRPDADVIPDVSYEWRFETRDALENVITLLETCGPNGNPTSPQSRRCGEVRQKIPGAHSQEARMSSQDRVCEYVPGTLSAREFVTKHEDSPDIYCTGCAVVAADWRGGVTFAPDEVDTCGRWLRTCPKVLSVRKRARGWTC